LGVVTSAVVPDGTVISTALDGTKTTALTGPDPRWGMQSPILSSLSMTTPGGRASSVTGSRSVTLAEAGNPLSLTSQSDTLTSNGKTTTRAFDKAAGKITTTTPAGRRGVVTLDAKARVTQVRAGDLAPVSFGYDARGRVETITQGSGSDARTTTMSYDADGFVKDVTDPRSDKTTFSSYDGVGRVEESTLADTNKIGFGYDDAGNLDSLTPPGRSGHGFEHYASDLLKTYTAPDLGDGTPRTTTYTYDRDRRPDVIDPPGAGAIDFGYDSAGRLASTDFSRGSIAYAYAGATSKLASVTAPGSGATTFGYDGPLVTSIGATGPSPATVGYGYDSDLRVGSRTLNGANSVSYGYDNDGLVTSAGGMTLSWDPVDALIKTSTIGAFSTAHTYNSFGEPASDAASFNGTRLYNATYDTRDKLGRISTKTETVGGTTSTYSYTYDGRGRLTDVTEDGAAYRSYTYDANGNRLTASEDGGAAVTGTYDAQDRLTSYGDATYTYTPEGQLKTKTVGNETTSYTYDELGNLVKVELPDKTIDYVVDGMGRRVAKKVDQVVTDRFVYGQGIQPIAELNASGGIKSQFVYASKSHVPDLMIKNGTTYRFVTDQVGSVRMVVNSSTGEVVHQIDYDPFGKVLNDSNPGFQPFGFAGGLYDSDTGLIRFGARDYDAAVGRFTAKDPILFNGGDTTLYVYVSSDPVNRIDPLGLCPWCVGALIGGVAGAVGAIVTGGDLGDVLTSAAIGAAAGATFGFAAQAGLVVTPLASGAASAFGDFVGQSIASDCPINIPEVIGAGVGGAWFSGIGSAVSSGAAVSTTGRVAIEATAGAFGEIYGTGLGYGIGKESHKRWRQKTFGNP
jgi:RHS repeat-associated protein